MTDTPDEDKPRPMANGLISLEDKLRARRSEQSPDEVAEARRIRQLTEEREWRDRQRRLGIPRKYFTANLASFEAREDAQKQASDISHNFVNDFARHRNIGTSMILCGNVGTGKTHLGIAILKAILQLEYVGQYFTSSGLLREIRSTYQRQSVQSESELFDRLTNLDLLVIDEVGTGRGSDDERLQFFDVINQRYNALRPTLLISNLELSELGEYLGQAVMDRLSEGESTILPFTWASYRSSGGRS